MSERDQGLLHIWLIEDAGDGLLFLADIERMLSSLAGRYGEAPVAISKSNGRAASSERVFRVTAGEVWDRLALEAGVHRAQVVPRNSETGRIATFHVGVELLDPGPTPSTGKPDLPIVKTYNYVQRMVIHHATGERLVLDAVISGQA
jgi:protein subunit release factor A